MNGKTLEEALNLEKDKTFEDFYALSNILKIDLPKDTIKICYNMLEGGTHAEAVVEILRYIQNNVK